MAAEKAGAAMIGLIFVFNAAIGQHLGTTLPNNSSGICLSMVVTNGNHLYDKLKDCVVVLGNLRLVAKDTVTDEFANLRFPNLREVTGFLVVYRLGLESVGHLFPNLTRIRGDQLITNYALIVYDMSNLREIGLYSLLKIDRGGVNMWGGRHTCYVKTIDWNAIAPNSRHSLTYPEMRAHCNSIKPCRCGPKTKNRCWNSKRCQRFLSDQEQSCHPECLGCSSSKPNICSACRHFTHRGRCVSRCPPDTILLPANQYCVTIEECQSLNGWIHNNTCVFDCPVNYEKVKRNGNVACEPCVARSCDKVCGPMIIHSLSEIQQAENCVYIDGPLIVEVSSVPGAVDELKKYLRLIEQVQDYIHIYSSMEIKSLDFLPNLRKITGRELINNIYSLFIHDMKNFQDLFLPSVIKDLTIDRGKIKLLNNPMLCMSKINELRTKFPVASNETDIPPGLNGYSGGCEDYVGLRVEILNETSAKVYFSPKKDSAFQYTVLYAKVPPGLHANFVPESCIESEWFIIHSNKGEVLLTSLHPASTYAVCVEALVHSKNPVQSYFARTTVINFTMPFVKPEPPFIYEIVATSSNAVGLRWIDHKNYLSHITSYQLDVALIEIPSRDLKLRDHCKSITDYDIEEQYSRHTLAVQPPVEYQTCVSSCSKLITFTEKNNFMEDHIDMCSNIEDDCNRYEEKPLRNSSFHKFVKTLALNLSASPKFFDVKRLAPYRDYRFSLRACVENKCSRSTRQVIRTLRSKTADVPSITQLYINLKREILIKWEPPNETNGPVLAFFIQVLPGGATDKETLPDVWCVYSEVRSLIVRSQFGKDFQVRVCSSTLGSYSVCSEWQRILIHEHYSFITGAVFGVTLIAVSLAIGLIYNRRRNNIDEMPLVDATSMYRIESEASDFMPFYSVPLN